MPWRYVTVYLSHGIRVSKCLLYIIRVSYYTDRVWRNLNSVDRINVGMEQVSFVEVWFYSIRGNHITWTFCYDASDWLSSKRSLLFFPALSKMWLNLWLSRWWFLQRYETRWYFIYNKNDIFISKPQHSLQTLHYTVETPCWPPTSTKLCATLQEPIKWEITPSSSHLLHMHDHAWPCMTMLICTQNSLFSKKKTSFLSDKSETFHFCWQTQFCETKLDFVQSNWLLLCLREFYHHSTVYLDIVAISWWRLIMPWVYGYYAIWTT